MSQHPPISRSIPPHFQKQHSSRPRQDEKGLASIPPEILLCIFQCLVPRPTTLHLACGTRFPSVAHKEPEARSENNGRRGQLHIYKWAPDLVQQFHSLPSQNSLDPCLIAALRLPFTTLTADPPLFPPQQVDVRRSLAPKSLVSELVEGCRTLTKLARTCVAFLGPARTALYEVLILGGDHDNGKRLLQSIKHSWIERSKQANEADPTKKYGLLSLIRVLMIDYRGMEHGVSEFATQACTELLKCFDDTEQFGVCSLESLVVRGLTTARIPHLRSSLTAAATSIPIASRLRTLSLTGEAGVVSLPLITRLLPLLTKLRALTLMGFSSPISRFELDRPENTDTLCNRTVGRLVKRLPSITASGPNGATSTEPPAKSPKSLPIEWLDGLPSYKLEKLALYGCKLSGGSILQMVGLDPGWPWEGLESDSHGLLSLRSFVYHATYANSPIPFPSPTLSLAIFLSHPLVANSPLKHLSIGPSPYRSTPPGGLADQFPLRDGLSFPFHHEDPIFSLRNLETLEVYSRKLPPLLPFSLEANISPPSISVLEMLSGEKHCTADVCSLNPITNELSNISLIPTLRSIRLIVEKMDHDRSELEKAQVLEKEIRGKNPKIREIEIIWLDTGKNSGNGFRSVAYAF